MWREAVATSPPSVAVVVKQWQSMLAKLVFSKPGSSSIAARGFFSSSDVAFFLEAALRPQQPSPHSAAHGFGLLSVRFSILPSERH